MLLGLGAIAIAIVTLIIAWPGATPATTVPSADRAATDHAITAPEPTTAAGDVPASDVAATPAPPTTTDVAAPDPTTADEHHEHGRRPSSQAAATEPPPPAPPESVVAATGHLVLDASPYAIVTLEGRRLGITPIEVDLPAGAHVLTLRNPEQGLETTYRVTIRGGETVRRTVALE
jgi:serine/threonine-protein kinase